MSRHSTPSAALRPRGQSRVHRNTYDIDSPQASIHAPLGNDGTVESAMAQRKALLEVLREVQIETANAIRYGQGIISDVLIKGVELLLDPKNGYDLWSGTNDLAVSQIAEMGGFSKRHWRRVKKVADRFGIMCFVHRSIKSGLERAAGVDQDIQISDLYYFSPAKLMPFLRARFEAKVAKWRRERNARERREGFKRPRTPIVKRDRPKCRIPARLNPVAMARCLAAAEKASAAPTKTYAEQEAEAIAFATRHALISSPG